MFEYQVIVAFQGTVIFRTEWHVGGKQARELAWMLASRLGERYDIGVAVRREEFVAVPWQQFGLEEAA